MKRFRKPAVAGLFYPAHPDILRHKIISLLKETQPLKKENNIKAIIVPHAGYEYSGKTAAYAFNHLENEKIENVIIISPSHYEYFDGISIYPGDGYSNPLGELNINTEIVNQLIKNSTKIIADKRGHNEEHGIEVELPFLQEVLGEFSIVPLVIGDQSKKNVEELAEKLSSIVNDNTLLVASSDLSHFYTNSEADKLDYLIEKRINDFEIEELEKDFFNKKCEACGQGAILSVMTACKNNDVKKSKVLNRTDSSYITGDKKSVVGYLSAIFSKN